MKATNIPQRVLDRASGRITKTEDGCWQWGGALSSGYGRIGWREGGTAYWASVHRVMYEYLVGPIPEGLDLDHTCHKPTECTDPKACMHRRCCNPEHLEPVSRQENLRRGGTIPAARSAITHCPAGHEYDETNTSTDKEGRRYCRTCVRLRNRAYYHRNKEARAAYNREWRQRNIGSK